MLVRVKNIGQYGVNKDLSEHELPINTWTDAQNIRFLNNSAYQFYGHKGVYGTTSEVPQHVFALDSSGNPNWIYLTQNEAHIVTVDASGNAESTDLTPASPITGVTNEWTSTMLGGIPIINNGTDAPHYWDKDKASNFTSLSNWTAGMTCKSLRTYKNYLIALNVTKSGSQYPYMVKWSSPAEPASLPSTWDETDATADAGEFDLAEGEDKIVDGLQLRDSFIVYKEKSIWRLDFVGGVYIFKAQKVLGSSGAMNKNCIVEVSGVHIVLTESDIIAHDGNAPTSILDSKARRELFKDIDPDYKDKCFVFKNIFFNEVFICYPSIGASTCDKAVVYNYREKTVTYRTLPNISHASDGFIDDSLTQTFDSDSDTFDSDLTLFDGGSLVSGNNRVLMCPDTTELFLLDGSASYDETIPDAYMERQGLSFDMPEAIKLVREIRPRITGNNGDTIIIKVAGMSDPYDTPVYTAEMTHTIGTTLKNDCLVNGRYIAVRFETGTAYQFKIDSFDIDIEQVGLF